MEQGQVKRFLKANYPIDKQYTDSLGENFEIEESIVVVSDDSFCVVNESNILEFDIASLTRLNVGRKAVLLSTTNGNFTIGL